MRNEHLVFVSMPALRTRDLQHMPRLRAMAESGARAELIPTFPCVTSPVQANMLTGRGPSEHGIIGNGFYDRDRGQVELWVGRNGLVQGEQLWDALAGRGISQAAWIPQNIKDAAADFIITPEPKHHPDGRTELWCYSKPDTLYERLLAELGHFPLMNFWGPMTHIKATQWTIEAALWLLRAEKPRFNYIYFPHLDYAAQKFGPDSDQQAIACGEADEQLGRLFDGVDEIGLGSTAFLIVSEYAMTDVSRVLYPNRLLRDAGLLSIDEKDGREFLNVPASRAVAVVDHQFAHVYVHDPADLTRAAAVFANVAGIAEVLSGEQRASRQVDHARSGEVVLVCEPDAWLAYYWWLDDAKAPAFARTVDIHNKPGYDPVEMFVDMPSKQTPLDATLIKGSHGAPADGPNRYGACVASSAAILGCDGPIHDTNVRGIIEAAL